jgi:hypothetical protein
MSWNEMSPKTISIESRQYFNYSITSTRLWNPDIETKVNEKTKSSRDKICKTYWRMEFINHKRNANILQQTKVDTVEKKLAQYKQK